MLPVLIYGVRMTQPSERAHRAMEEALRNLGETEHRPAPMAQVPAPASPTLHPQVIDLYKHAMRSLAWALFWTSAFGGTAALITAMNVPRIELPLAVVAFLAWGTFGACISLASRSDSRSFK